MGGRRKGAFAFRGTGPVRLLWKRAGSRGRRLWCGEGGGTGSSQCREDLSVPLFCATRSDHLPPGPVKGRCR